MKIAIIDCDRLDKNIVNLFGNYGDMIYGNLFKDNPNVKVCFFNAIEQKLPDENNFDAAIISGSKSDSFSKIPWIITLRDWCKQTSLPIVGICFGHQILALAHEGQVSRAPMWGAGHKRFSVVEERPWMDVYEQKLSMMVMHQDQVTELPSNAIHTLEAHHCKIFGFEVPDRCITFQGHPEYEAGYMRLILERRRKQIGEKLSDQAIRNILLPTSKKTIVTWICKFLKADL